MCVAYTYAAYVFVYAVIKSYGRKAVVFGMETKKMAKKSVRVSMIYNAEKWNVFNIVLVTNVIFATRPRYNFWISPRCVVNETKSRHFRRFEFFFFNVFTRCWNAICTRVVLLWVSDPFGEILAESILLKYTRVDWNTTNELTRIVTGWFSVRTRSQIHQKCTLYWFDIPSRGT